MATYLDFRRITQRDGLRPFYWVCGEEVFLREQVAKSLSRAVPAQPEDRQQVSTEDGEATVWEALDSWPLDPDRRALLIVREAERLQHLDRLGSWLKDRTAPNRLVVFLAAEPRWPTTREPQVRELVTRRGMYVECGLSSQSSSVEVVSSWLGGDHVLARRLLARTGWQLRPCRDAIAKAARIGRKDWRILEYLTEPTPYEQFVAQLTACDRSSAVQSAVQLIIQEERSQAVGLLDSNLEALSRINRALRSSFSQREIAARLDLHRVVVERLAPFARLYDREAVRRRAVVLQQADSALAQGATVGVLEVLAARW